MLKHCIATKRNRIHSTSSNASCEDLVDLGNLFAQTAGSSTATTPGGTSGGSGSQRQLHQPQTSYPHQLSPSAGCSLSGTNLTATTLGGCFGGGSSTNRWSSTTSNSGVSSYRQHKSDDEDVYEASLHCISGGSNQSIGNRSSNEDCTLSNTTSPAKIKHTTFRLPRKRPSANPSVVASTSKQDSASNTEIMRRWNSFHSTRGECHPNRFRRNRKTSQNINPGRLRKPSSDDIIKVNKIPTDSNTLHTNISYEKHMTGRHSVSYARNSIQEESKFIAKTWHLRRGKSLADEKSLSCVTEDDSLRADKNTDTKKLSLPIDDIDENTSTDVSGKNQGFGKRNGGSVRRSNECFVLETSEMIVIEYPEMSMQPTTINSKKDFHLSNSNDPKHYASGKLNDITEKDINCISGSGSNSTGEESDNQSVITTALKDQPQQQQLSPKKQNLFKGLHDNVRGNMIDTTSYQHRNSTPVLGIEAHPHQHRNSTPAVVCSNINSSYRPFSVDHLTKLPPQIAGNRPELYQKCNRGSHSSDTSSAYSGSDTMTSAHSSSLDAEEVDLSGLVESVVDSDEEDLAESIDSLNIKDAVRECLEKDPSERHEDDLETLLDFTQGLKAFTNMTLPVRRALCSVMVFAVVDKAGTMVMSDGEELDSWSVLINGHVEIEHQNGEKEELNVGDSFGILPTMDKLYHRGIMKTKCDDCQFVCITQTDYYRIQHQGEENIKRHEDQDGQVVMVTELRQIGCTNSGIGMTSIVNVQDNYRRAHVVIRGTIEQLIRQLIDENSIIDSTYIEDFLLTHRTIVEHPKIVADQLLQWFEHTDSIESLEISVSEIRDRVTRVVLLWVNNHFRDFDMDSEMMDFLEKFESGLDKYSMHSQLRLLHIACAAKSRARIITLTRSSREENLHFTICGGFDLGNSGIFISKVEKDTKAEDIGLKRGDQILEVNGQNFEYILYSKALEILMGSTHLCITIKSNLLAFKEMLKNELRQQKMGNSRNELSPAKDRRNNPRLSMPAEPIDQVDHHQSSHKDNFVTNFLKKEARHNSSPSTFINLGPKSRIQRALIKMNLLPKNNGAIQLTTPSGSCDGNENVVVSTDVASSSAPKDEAEKIVISNENSDSAYIRVLGGRSGSCTNSIIDKDKIDAVMHQSHSNPDLKSLASPPPISMKISVTPAGLLQSEQTFQDESNRQSDYPECVVKIYKADQSCKYLLVHKETTSREVVMLALQEFGIHETSSNFSLCEVSVGEGGMIKQRRLPDQFQNLSDRIGLSARYYLKTNGISETLVSDELAPDLIRDSQVHFLQLNANEIAVQLTVQDFEIFRKIESAEYIDDLFELKSHYGTPKLEKFAKLVNHEMFWVVTEICSEHNSVRRMKIIKQFIKIARQCKECRNFNSMFAIISGLGHVAVSRLRSTWEKLPSKYQKLFEDLQDLMDPSRNMSKYRQLVSAESLAQHPIIPFYPVVKKDLTFIHLGNDTYIENLINFEKLRMISKEIRVLGTMCSSSTVDLLAMLESKVQTSSNSALIALNQMMTIASNSVGANTNIGGGVSSTNVNRLSLQVGNITVKRRKKSGIVPNPKKMFEEGQMVRRVKTYLGSIKVISDEDILHNLSLECEPPTNISHPTSTSGSAPNTAITIRKRHPSPTLSTTSSTSSTSEGKKGGASGGSSSTPSVTGQCGPKFGAASPQAVKKILSLSESTKTRPHQSLRINNVSNAPLLPLHYQSASPSPSPSTHRRVGSSSSAGSSNSNSTTNSNLVGILFGQNQSGTNNLNTPPNIRLLKERTNSDTPLPVPVDLSAESSSVTSLGNLTGKKVLRSGSVTPTDSGHSSFVHMDVHMNPNCFTSSGIYHVASSILHNSPTSPANSVQLQQRRHSSTNESPILKSQQQQNNVNRITGVLPLHKNFLHHHHPEQPNLYHNMMGSQLEKVNIDENNFSQCNRNIFLKNNELLQFQKPIILPDILRPKRNLNDFSSNNNKIYSNNNNNNNNNYNNNNNNNGNRINNNDNEIILNGQYDLYNNSTSNGYGQQKQQLNNLSSKLISVQPLINLPPTSISSKTLTLPSSPLQTQQSRQPPTYNVAAQMARLHRLGTLGRAHSHEGVATPILSLPNDSISSGNIIGIPTIGYYQQESQNQPQDNQHQVDDDDENGQISAV